MLLTCSLVVFAPAGKIRFRLDSILVLSRETPMCASMTAAARAHSNIALIKYWGKRDKTLNLPAVGSISITLAGLYTDTHVTFDPNLDADRLRLDGRPVDTRRVSHVLDLIRNRANCNYRAAVDSRNNFPTGAGLASSASGFAALTVAACAAASLDVDDRELSIMARQGSGSAARSIFGGYAEMQRGEARDGSDAYARPLLDGDTWPLDVVVAVTQSQAKSIDSRAGMGATAASSPFYPVWVEQAETDLQAMRTAIDARDFHALGTLAEHSCLKMHALMLSNHRGLIYWNAATVAAMHVIRDLRAGGVPVYFTIDAGPQIKALCLPEARDTVTRALAATPGVERVLPTGLGPRAHRVDD